MTITKEEFFSPGKMSAKDKASATDQAARQIVQAEAADRARKTERLRLLREAQQQEAAASPPAPAKAKASRSRKS